MNTTNRRIARAAAGFTLIEILVAFAVATLMLGAIYDVFSTGLRSIAVVQHYRDAVLLGESALDTLAAVPVAPGEDSERIGIYERSTRIRTRLDLMPKGLRQTSIPYEIEVAVGWRDGVRQRAVSFSTIRLGLPPS